MKQRSVGVLFGWLGLSLFRMEAAMEAGEVVLIDFGSVAPAVDANFNDFNDVVIENGATKSFAGALVDSSGEVVSEVGFSVTNQTGQSTGRATGNNGAEGVGLFSDSRVYGDWLISNDTSAAPLTDGDEVIDGSGDRGNLSLAFTGLDDNLTYNLSGGFDNNNDNFNIIWQAGGQSFTTDGTDGIGYGNLTGVTTDGNGRLEIHVIRIGNEAGRHVAVGALSLEAVAATALAFGKGEEVRVDFGATLPAVSNYNLINSGVLSVSELVRFSDGESSGVGLTVTATNPFDNSANVASTAGLTRVNSVESEVYGDGFLSTDGNNGFGNDLIMLTFSGLDDDLYYDLTGALSRASGGSNFSTSWSVNGVTLAVSDGTEENGHVELKSLSSTGGSLVVSLTDNVRQSGLAQLSLVATDVPPPTPSAPVLPSLVDFAFENDETLLLQLDQVGSDFLLQQSDDLVFFDTSKYRTENEDGEVLRVEGLEEVDPNGDGRSFFRTARQPNFVIIFTDDQGYQDLGCYGSPTIETPRIDALAREGIRFTDFYAQAVCGPSRDALLTGCYPLRTAHHPNVEDRTSPHPRLELSEITIAEVLREEGYATAAYGKWDLDGRFEFSSPSTHGPTAQGFDSYFPTTAGNPTATESATDEAISFIQANKEKPFFAYVAYSMPHIELATTPAFANFTGEGIYADVMAEIDHNVGRIVDTLTAEGLDEMTYVMFISDNGPWYLGNSSVHINRYGSSAQAEEMGGSALPLRGDKTTSWEGGFRVPSIMWAPGRIPGGRVFDELATTLDVMPTIANLAGAEVPADRVIDGKDITSIIHGVPGAESETEAFFFYVRETLHAVRVGKWKLHVPHAPDTFWERFYRTGDYFEITSPLLYDLEADIGETTNVAAENPEVVAELMEFINFARNDIGDFDQVGVNAR